MARYVYACPNCEEHFEMEKPMAQAGRLESCPSCGSVAQRVYTPPMLSRLGESALEATCESSNASESCHTCQHAPSCRLH
jgi:putative FmdB family regulatory protein